MTTKDGKQLMPDRPDRIPEMADAGEKEIHIKRSLPTPWGNSTLIESNDDHQVKILDVAPGEQLSLQYHRYRAEFWLVLEGAGVVEVDGNLRDIFRGDGIPVPLGSTHRLSNPGKRWLKVIEVQTGEYFGEDDIIRLEDKYGRHLASRDIS